MNISTVIQQLTAFYEQYGDIPVYHVIGQTYFPLAQNPWLASPGGVSGPLTSYIVVFGSLVAAQATNHREHSSSN